MRKVLYLFLAFHLFSLHVLSNVQSRFFVHINGENGLSQSNIKAIIQDSYGFMWFGTKNGLNRYDGQRILQFNCYDHVLKCGNNNISSLYEDEEHTLWIGTDEGVYLYNPTTDIFTFLNALTEQKESINTWISKISEDSNGDIWICAPKQGVFKYTKGKLYSHAIQGNRLPHDFCICPNGDIYAVSWYTGILKYNPQTQTFVQITQDSTGKSLLGLEVNTLSLQHDYIIMSVQNGDLKKYNTRKNLLTDITLQSFKNTFTRFATVYGDEIYAGTHDGLYILNEKKGTVEHFKQNLLNPSTLSDDIICTIYKDNEDGLWLGTMFGGVNYQPKNTLVFQKHLHDTEKKTLSSCRIREITEDIKGNLWIGTENAGLSFMPLHTHQLKHIPITGSKPNNQTTVTVSSDGENVYCSMFKDGMVVIDSKGHSKFYHDHELNISSGCSLYALYTDKEGTLWAGSDNGVFYTQKGNYKFTALPQMQGQWVFDILQDTNGTFWFATMGNGVWRYDPATQEIRQYTNSENEDGNTISSNSVSSIMQDSKGNIWFSTDRGGLCRYEISKDRFTRFSIQEGMPDDIAYKVLEDDHGYLWFGTNRGLVRFKPDNKDISVFTVNDGLSSNEFNYKSAFKGSDGNFYFGTIEGLISFNPNFQEEENSIPPLYITRFSIYNEEMTVHKPNSPLKQSILNTQEITLPYNQANINFDIAMLSYSTAQTNKYYYKLEPIDKQWIRTNSENNISYANLPPGSYELHLRATPKNGVSANDIKYATRKLSITVLPPWWRSTWAYCIYIILAICAYTLWFHWYRKHKHKQFKEQQRLFESEKEKELNQNKIDFFTEIAHEIRTPLTLINGPLEIIQEMNIQDAKLAKNLNVIAKNTKRLLNLASQLLDFQKMGANKMALNLETVNVSELLQETVNRFEPTYTLQHKELQIEQIHLNVMAKIDKEAITKILSNLLNNGLKYGQHLITVNLSKSESFFSVSVSSDGEKIAKERAEQIFEPFFQSVEKRYEKQGVGIGLTLARSLALLHKGSLMLDTTQPNNTFVLTIPLNLSEEEANLDEPMIQTNLPLNETTSSEEYTKGTTILLVEDESNILAFMKERLQESFIVETALNGKIALDILHKEHVDIVISDVMMPEMDGYELCKEIKSDINLSHIPIIFLTAKNDIESKIKGLQIGAEAYIEKPFSFDFLEAQIRSLLQNRQKERKAFSKRPFFPIQNMQMSKEDEEFMQKVLDTINVNLRDETFNVERMADELCMSRSSLLRKIKTLFNMSPIDFIRLIRLKRSAELIQEGKYRVGEICYMVGFSSHSYFSKLFFKQFGMTPKDFEKQVASTRNKIRNSSDINIVDLIQGNKQNP